MPLDSLQILHNKAMTGVAGEQELPGKLFPGRSCIWTLFLLPMRVALHTPPQSRALFTC